MISEGQLLIYFKLKLTQEIHNLGLAPFDRANKFAAHNAVAIDDVGFGPFKTAVKITGLLVGIADGGKVNFIIFEKLVISIAVDIYAYS